MNKTKRGKKKNRFENKTKAKEGWGRKKWAHGKKSN